MSHDISLIALIAVGLTFAFAGGFVAVRLGLPPLVGYLLAGVAVGPFTPGFVGDPELAHQLAELGVILLMFGVGMHFSLGDLWEVRAVAVPGAAARIAAVTLVAVGVAYLWGWPLGGGLVFGLSLSVASTVVLLKAMEARGELQSDEGRVAVGWLIVEDLIIVLVLVLLPALAPAGDGAARNLWVVLARTLGLVAVFAVLMLGVGSRAFPWLLRKVEATESRELFTLAVVAIALGVAFASYKVFGVSFALGAFFAGMVVKASDQSHRAEKEMKPLEDVFAVLFFVSAGMLLDPWVFVTQPLRVLAVVGVIVAFKAVATFGIIRGLGGPAKTALPVSVALAQIGEFSFILAGLGVATGLLPADGQNLIVAGAIVSITVNPLVLYAADRWGGRVEQTPTTAASAGGRPSADREGVNPDTLSRAEA